MSLGGILIAMVFGYIFGSLVHFIFGPD